MLSKTMTGLVAVMLLGAAAATPAIGASSKQRGARPAASYIPPPAYGVRGDGRAHSSNPVHDVYVNGKYAGSDPDPRIRASIARDPWPGNDR
jgi:hypothetical protein